MRIAPAVTLNPEQRAAWERRARSRSFPARGVERARIVNCVPLRDKRIRTLPKLSASRPKKLRAGAGASLWAWWGWRKMRPVPVAGPASAPA